MCMTVDEGWDFLRRAGGARQVSEEIRPTRGEFDWLLRHFRSLALNACPHGVDFPPSPEEYWLLPAEKRPQFWLSGLPVVPPAEVK